MTTPGAAPDERSDSRSPGVEERSSSQEAETAASNSAGPVLIVGLGASAGGLRAFEPFFKHMPPESGMAFIVVQHLPPDYKSELPRVLQQYTSMQVCEAEDGGSVEPDCVYVIPPNCQLTIKDGRLTLSELASQRGHSAPIDLFFRSLAADRKEMAACVVLSGLGTDGTAGLRAVKEAGGITLVQDQKEAEYDSMPASAIATGLVDFVLPAEGLAGKLLELAQGLRRAARQADAALSEDESAALQNIFAHLRAQTGQDFSQYKRSTVLRRIERRILVHQAERISDYLAILLARSEETNALLRSLLISVTYFFRDRDAFRVLEHQVVPRLFKERSDGSGMRVWIPGCSTGEEAYSIAMLLLEYAAEHGFPADFQIFATDVDEDAIAFGRSGLYSEAIAADISRKRLERFFTWEGEGYRVRKEVREKVLFAAHSLIKDPPFSHIDLIMCRNVLIYLNRDVQDQIFDVFHYALRPGGYLFLGMSESADRATNLFVTIDKKHHVFRRRSGAHRVPRMSSPSMLHIERQDQTPVRKGVERRMLSFADVHQRLLMERYAPPSVIVNESDDIVHISGDARPFLHIAEGEPTQNLLRIVWKDLRIELRTSLHQVRREGGAVQSGVVHLQRDDGVVPIRLHVSPITDPEEASGFIQIIFESLPEEGGVPAEVSRPATVDPLVEQLQEQVARLEEAERALRENEARWRTVVEQNPDPIVVSREGQIVYINRAGAEILGAAAPEDVIGRSLFDFTPPALHEVRRERLATVKHGRATEPMKMTLIRLDGRELLVETFSHPVLFEGAPAAQTVIRNLPERKRAEEIVRRSEERFAKAFRAAPVAMIITRLGSGRIVDVNDHFIQMTGYGPEEAVGRKASDMELSIHRIWRDRVGNMLEEGGRYEDVEAQIGSKSGEVHDVLSSGEVIEFGGETCLLSMFYDITARKRLEQEVLEVAESERRRIGQDLHDGLGQQLTGIAFLTKLLEQNLQNVSPDHAGQVRRIVELLSQAISYTRNLSRLLSPVDIQADTLTDALRRLAESTQDYFGLTCHFEAASDLKAPNNRVATHLYRITQEAVNNALKHAGADEIVIEFVAAEGQGILRIRDNGRGIPTEPGDKPNGMGMRTMRYRSHVIGGTFNVRPGDDGGTLIEVRFPMTD